MKFSWALLSLLWGASALASDLKLIANDPAGAPLAATATLIEVRTGYRQTFTLPRTVSSLTPGRFRLEVTAPGFATEARDLDLTQDLSLALTLNIRPAGFRIDVTSTAPLPGVERSLEEIPIPLRTATAQDVENSGALNLPDFLNRRLGSVHLNEIQGNPYQVDLNFRGYTASPLLGTPQGLSVYMDGVRLNQPFGDILSWDLIPRTAIAEMSLVPGPNPLFGLNTLGGALAIETRDGRRHPGSLLEFSGGSFGRRNGYAETAGYSEKGFDWLLSANLFFEDGWRDASPSNVRQIFARTGWQGRRSSVHLSTTLANNSLAGNGLQDHRLLAADWRSVYTKPDITNNRSPFFNLRLRHALTSQWQLSGNVYFRHITTSTLNGDINEESLDQQLYNLSNSDAAALRAAGFSGFPLTSNAANTPFPFWRCIAQVLQRDEPSEKCNGLLNRGFTAQDNYGLAAQLSRSGRLASLRHQFTLGGAWDGNRVDFRQSTELGYLNPDRSVTPLGAFADGVTGGEVDGEPFDTRVDLASRIYTASLFATDTISLNSRLHLTVSGRYNRTRIDNRDRILPGGGRGSLDGNHLFQRFNPAFGLTWGLRGGLSAYANYTEGSRAPTAIELGCADPESPCRLPNSMAGDPPLRQVISRGVEAGLRGNYEGRYQWSAGFFRADNRNDILFVASEQTGFGYFRNFGLTRRQGFEASFDARLGRVYTGANYNLLAATFESPEEVNGTGNSTNEEGAGLEGTIEINPGARIPLIPRHIGKAFVDVQLTRRLSLDLGATGISSQFARGNENNLHAPDGRFYLGAGSTPAYAVLNSGARFALTSRIQLFATVNNLLDRRYYSSAQLAHSGFTAAGNFIARPFGSLSGQFPLQGATFFAPGAPRGAWAGVRWRF